MAMTRRDFQLIANAIWQERGFHKNGRDQLLIDLIAVSIANRLSEKYMSFNRDMFLKEAGCEEDEEDEFERAARKTE